MKKQLYTLLCYYLGELEIQFNKAHLKQKLSSHPDNNSLYIIVDTLEEMHIENIMLRLNMDNLMTNGFPVIVYTEEDEGTIIIVENIVDNQIYYYNSKTGKDVKSLEEFESRWTGIALYAAQDEIRAELDKKKSTANNRIINWRTPLSIIAGLVCFASWCFSVEWSYNLVCLLTLCSIGLTISILLTMHDFGEKNILIHKVCHLNRLTNCNMVLSSSAAKLFGWLSMSDIGLCYFTGTVFSLLFAGTTPHIDATISLLLVIALCSFPYTLFSLSYQFFKLKKVCPMCLGVIGVLWAEITLAIFNLFDLQLFPISPVAVFSLFAGFSIPVIAWAYVKPLWKEYNRVHRYEYHYLRLKRTPDVVRAVLAKEQTLDMEFSFDEINLGSIEAPVHITVVLNFYCKPCVDEWVVLNRLLSTYPDSLRATVRFFGYNLLGVETEELIDALTNINNISGNDAFRDALTNWYAEKDFQKWKTKYRETISITPQVSSIKNAKWIHTYSISGVPALFFNNHKCTSLLLDDLECLLKAF